MQPILEVAIGLTLLMVVFSVVVSATVETVSMVASMRARQLEKGIANMLADGDEPGLAPKVLEHPLVKALRRMRTMRREPGKPAYIPSDIFSAALLDEVLRGVSGGLPGLLLPSQHQIDQAIDKFPDEQDRAAVREAWKDAQRRPQTFVAALHSAHPNDPDRVSNLLGLVGITKTRISERVQRLPDDVPVLDQVKASWRDDPDIAEFIRDLPVARPQDLRNVPDVIDEAIERIQNENLKTRLQAIRRTAGDNLDDLRKGVETWFDNQMDRVSGWYTRWAQWLMLFVGIAVALALNVSATTVARVLWNDPVLRTELVSEAERAARTPTDTGEPTDKGAADEDAEPETAEPATAVGTKVELSRFPVGWNDTAWPGWNGYLLLHLLGIFAVGLAATLGAPFWYDALMKVANLRSTGPRPPSSTQEQRPQ